ncbi:tetratricopeptide repeat protein [Roseibacillus ishigakijimensis]|uniref:Tetratricopeptide repeat protein n=1 Tax=Roseibacillus ishigakijimensis TaxID=454146 RepID=A0A934VJZ8_9BACT|nr:tetratricopeptide repeat protein [Roseibacillus ishigakijimensis]MBK1833134.1 tetratricopeptide repeat protein [Roseibacillus ishigakijimensis]
MKFPLGLLLLLAFIFPLSIQAEDEFSFPELKKWALENQEKFPFAETGRKNGSPFAPLTTFPELDLNHQGKAISGLRITLPDWTDENLALMLTAPPIAESGVFFKTDSFHFRVVLLEDSKRTFYFKRKFFSNPTAKRYKVFQSFYPDREQFVAQTIFRQDERSGTLPGDTLLVLILDDESKKLPKTEVAFTIESERGLREWGQLPTALSDYGPGANFITIEGEDPGKASEHVEKAYQIFIAEGEEEANRFLDEIFLHFQQRGGKYQDWHSALWHSAQYRHKNDKNWSIVAYGYIYKQAKKWDAYERGRTIASNLATSYNTLYRHAEGRKHMDMFYFQMHRMGYSFQIQDYPETGPGIPILPNTRTREIPLDPPTPISIVWQYGFPYIMDDLQLDRTHVSALEDHAHYLYLSGEQEAAMEWRLSLLNLLERMKGFKEDYEVDERWLEINNSIASQLYELGYYAASYYRYQKTIHSNGLKAGAYGYRSHQSAKIGMANCRSAISYAEDGEMERIANVKEKIRKNPFLNKASFQNAELVEAKHYLIRGERENGMAIIDRLADEEGYIPAKVQQVIYHIQSGTTAGMEKKLLALLKLYREQGLKIKEWRLYAAYADLLILEERWEEALQMRREALRLTRAFGLTVHEAHQAARLSQLLQAFGQESEAEELARATREVARNKTLIPPFNRKVIEGILRKELPPISLASRDENAKASTHLQPNAAVVVPLAASGGYGKLTLANLSDQAVTGQLELSGLPSSWQENALESEVTISIGAGEARAHRPLTLAPGTFLLLSLNNENPYQEGELLVEWQPEGESSQRSAWTFSTAEEGFNKAVIDAGHYHLNEFYGVPVYHHLIKQAATDEEDMTFRVQSSAPARIEVYDLEDKPLLVDNNGDGNLIGAGDGLFSDQNQDGLVDTRLRNGLGAIRLQVYPQAGLTTDLTLTLSGLIDGEWSVLAEDTLTNK